MNSWTSNCTLVRFTNQGTFLRINHNLHFTRRAAVRSRGEIIMLHAERVYLWRILHCREQFYRRRRDYTAEVIYTSPVDYTRGEILKLHVYKRTSPPMATCWGDAYYNTGTFTKLNQFCFIQRKSDRNPSPIVLSLSCSHAEKHEQITRRAQNTVYQSDTGQAAIDSSDLHTTVLTTC